MLEFIVILNICATLLVWRRLNRLNLHCESPDALPAEREEVADEPDDSVDSDVLTESEIQRLEREYEFDQRIKQMKEELASRLPARPQSEPALQLHPHVHNLPHNIISDDYDDLPDVEITQ